MKTIVFFDGQNIYRTAKDAWRTSDPVTYKYTYPCYDVEKLSNTLVSQNENCILTQIRFYTGVPSALDSPLWHSFWTNKLKHLRNQGIEVYKGYINHSGQEKGVDVKIAIDIIRLTYEKQFDYALILSQDRDFEPAINLAKNIARDQNRQIGFESHFIIVPADGSDRGIPGTTWKPIDKITYDLCTDSTDYRNL